MRDREFCDQTLCGRIRVLYSIIRFDVFGICARTAPDLSTPLNAIPLIPGDPPPVSSSTLLSNLDMLVLGAFGIFGWLFVAPVYFFQSIKGWFEDDIDSGSGEYYRKRDGEVPSLPASFRALAELRQCFGKITLHRFIERYFRPHRD
jgi:hypothetical protein